MATSSQASPGATAAELTYRDVQMILALLDSWPGGHVRLIKGDLSIEASLDARTGAGLPPVSLSSRIIIRSPGVGIFQRSPSIEPGARVGDEDEIGMVAAPGRSTAAKAGITGAFAEWLVASGEFVEYGQALAALSVPPE